jgi:hypothetical protein
MIGELLMNWLDVLKRLLSPVRKQRGKVRHPVGADNMTKECFVIMPFSETDKKKGHSEEYWTCFFEEFLTPALSECGYRARRSEATPGNIIEGIIQDLQGSNLVLAVLTDHNPNVWYELGVRHSLRKGTIMMIEECQKIPFDVDKYGVIRYAKDKDPAELAKDKKLKEDLARYIRRAEAGVQDSPVKDFLNMDLIFTINRALGRLREAITLIVRLCEEGECDEQKLIGSIKNLQKSWETECEEVAIVDLKRGSYEVILHRDPDHIGDKPSEVWQYVGGTKDSQGIRNLLEEEMKTSSEGLKVVELLNWEGRTTAFAYKRIKKPYWMIVVEAHCYLRKS